MRIVLLESAQRDLKSLDAEAMGRVVEAVLRLPGILGQPHLHGGAGLRKLHPRGIWESRIGLGLRVVFGHDAGVVTIHKVGTHDDVARYLKRL